LEGGGRKGRGDNGGVVALYPEGKSNTLKNAKEGGNPVGGMGGKVRSHNQCKGQKEKDNKKGNLGGERGSAN